MHLCVEDDWTERGAEGPVANEHVGDERHWDAERCHQDVTACQTDNEVVSDGAHAPVSGDDRTDSGVAADSDDDDDRVQDDNERFGVDGHLDDCHFVLHAGPPTHIRCRLLQQPRRWTLFNRHRLHHVPPLTMTTAAEASSCSNPNELHRT